MTAKRITTEINGQVYVDGDPVYGRVCSRCKEAKPRAAFVASKSNTGRMYPQCLECHARRVRGPNKKLRAMWRERLFEKYGRVCSRCGFSDTRALQLDHVKGGGMEERKHLSCDGIVRKALLDKSGAYQILCANCNWIKRFERGEVTKKKCKYV